MSFELDKSDELSRQFVTETFLLTVTVYEGSVVHSRSDYFASNLAEFDDLGSSANGFFEMTSLTIPGRTARTGDRLQSSSDADIDCDSSGTSDVGLPEP